VGAFGDEKVGIFVVQTAVSAIPRQILNHREHNLQLGQCLFAKSTIKICSFSSPRLVAFEHWLEAAECSELLLTERWCKTRGSAGICCHPLQSSERRQPAQPFCEQSAFRPDFGKCRMAEGNLLKMCVKRRMGDGIYYTVYFYIPFLLIWLVILSVCGLPD
jgi:hypothetical protein